MIGGTVRQCVVRVDAAIGSRIVAGRSLLGWLLREVSRFGVSEALLLADHVPPGLEESLPRPVRIAVSHPPPGVGTGGAVFHVREQLQNRFLLCDGAAAFDWNLAALLADAAGDGQEAVGRIARRDDSTNLGIGVFRKALVDHLRLVCDLQADVLPDLAARGLLRATTISGEATPTLDLPPDGTTTEKTAPISSLDGRAPRNAAPTSPFVSWSDLALPPTTSRPPKPQDMGNGTGANPTRGAVDDTTVACLRRKALFLDRDGVLNIDHGYVGSRDRFEWVDGALDAIRYATQAGWHVFIVTNQSGVARGRYSEDAVRDLLDWIAGQARAAGGTIDDARFCPFHPEATVDAYRQIHPWRKPLPGMLLDLIRTWELDPKRAVMIGDQQTDMAAAAAAGMAGHLFGGGNLLAFLRPILEGHA
jgi:D-glycero-D-manno-heptose 1,7-bisphosphate phosphatase